MAQIADIKRRVDVFKFNSAAETAFIEVEDDFAEENKKQLFAGYDKFQERLQHYASAMYAFYKSNRNPLPGLGNPDLFDTGAFFRAIQAIVSSGRILIGSTDSKSADLEVKYPGIFGLGGKFKAEFIAVNLRPAFMRQVHKELLL